jgi:hypothetical protein
VAFDHAPPNENEHGALQEFTRHGGTLVTGPRWRTASENSQDFKPVVGSVRGYPTQKLVDSDRFSRDVRGIVDDKHGAPKLYNVGTIISLFSVEPVSGRVLLQMTEYGDYPTENVTVKMPRKIAKATMHASGREPEELRIYEGEDGGSEIDVPAVPLYCAIIME